MRLPDMGFRHAIYETLGACWPIRKGHGRWLNLLASTLAVQPYGHFKEKPCGAYRLLLDPGDSNDRYFYFSTVGSGYTALLQRLVRRGDCVIDIGANVGHFSALAATCVGKEGRVHAVEANPSLIARLERLAGAADDGPVRVHHFAAWRSPGTIALNVATCSGWSSVRANDTFVTQSTVEVPARTLDQMIAQEGIASVRFLKLDIEGAELDALQGAETALAKQVFDNILLEAERFRLTAFGHRGSDIVELMDKHGYRLACVLDGDRFEPVSAANRIPGNANADYLYVRESQLEAALRALSGLLGRPRPILAEAWTPIWARHRVE